MISQEKHRFLFKFVWFARLKKPDNIMKMNKCNDECRVWTGLGTQHRTHLSQIMCPGSFPLTLTATVTYLFSLLSPKSETDPVKEDIREHYFLSVICLLVSQQYVHLPLRPLGSGQASLCHVLWFCRVFSGAQGQYLSPSSHRFCLNSSWRLKHDSTCFFFLPFFQVKPKTSAKVSGFKDRHNDWPGHVCLCLSFFLH